MRKIITSSAAAILLLIGTACGSSDPTSPPITSNPPSVSFPAPPAPPPAPTNFPPPSGPARVFVYDHAFWAPQAYTTQSRFVLYDNHAFALEYAPPIGEYRGAYTETNGVIVFDWEGWSIAGPWGATGTLNGDTLTVKYNIIMSLSDFEDAVYTLAK
ncbi:MAG TPA: hypothetical protein VM099_14535 [Gemmatimonadaceae bacterium]|nr:hypothetical protein [Gemmatimonadaceae bacterium]